jgi:hypothetical protein
MQTKVILENAGSWETPPPLSSFLKHGEMTVNAYCSGYGCSNALFHLTDRI